MLLFFRSLFFAPFVLIFSLSGSYLDQECVVWVRQPVADAVGKPLQLLDPASPVEQLYETLSFSPEVGANACPRIHQFIYNEVGRKVQTSDNGQEILVEFPHLFCENDKREKSSQFWLLSKALVALSQVQKACVDACIPEPLDCSKPCDQHCREHVLTLVLPWKDDATGLTYSAGTRFKRATGLDTPEAYGVTLLDCISFEPRTALIERAKSLVDYPRTAQEARVLFVGILRKWATLEPGKIAYLWGGCSIIETYKEDEFSRVSEKRGNDSFECWQRPAKSAPRGGCDCSGLILRAAQIAGLPYYFKNTRTLGLNLRDLQDGEELENGDLILLPGHVIVVSDRAKNELIQAVSYSSGYGVLHTLTLERDMEGVRTYADLLYCRKNRIPLTLLNKKGQPLKKVDSFRVLKLLAA